jgi:hypothetical protein
MDYDHKVTELIRMRSSWRTYDQLPLETRVLAELRSACAELDQGLFGEKLALRVVDLTETAPVGSKLGDYGTLKKVRYFLGGVIDDGPLAYESYGYRMEQLVLRATDLGLGTCWLGYFDRALFPDLQPGAGELFPAVSAVGYVASHRRLAERLIRTAVAAKKRKPWGRLFFSGALDRPLSTTDAGAYEGPLNGVRAAPSSGNTQPWRVVKDPGAPVFHFFMVVVKEGYQKRRLHDIDLGIGMSHFELVDRRYGLGGRWQILDSSPCPTPARTHYVASWIDDSVSD